MSLGPDDPTPNPDAATLEGLYRIVSDLRRDLADHKVRIARLEKPHEDIILTLNSHDDRLDKHDDRLDKLDEAVAEMTKYLKTAASWHDGISHAVKEMSGLLRELVGRVK